MRLGDPDIFDIFQFISPTWGNLEDTSTVTVHENSFCCFGISEPNCGGGLKGRSIFPTQGPMWAKSLKNTLQRCDHINLWNSSLFSPEKMWSSDFGCWMFPKITSLGPGVFLGAGEPGHICIYIYISLSIYVMYSKVVLKLWFEPPVFLGSRHPKTSIFWVLDAT